MFDVLLIVEIYRNRNHELSVKELQTTLNYSERGIKYALDQLVEQQWIEILSTNSDRRLRLVAGTIKTRELFSRFMNHFNSEENEN